MSIRPGSPKPDAPLSQVLVIAIVGAIVTGGLIGGIGTAIAAANQPPTPTYPPYVDPYEYPDGDYSDLAVGESGSPIAVHPTVCDGPCFDETSVDSAILTDQVFENSGLPIFKHVWKMTGDRTTAIELHRMAHETWEASGYGPEECFATWSPSPVSEPADAVVADGLVAPLTENSSDLYSITKLTQSVRLFPDTASAEAYMQTLSAGIANCTQYLDSNGYPIDVVTLEPSLPPPDTVAAVGFSQSPEQGTRYYVFDIQRGNMVIRSYAVSDGGLDDATFRTLMSKQALALDELVPVSPVE